MRVKFNQAVHLAGKDYARGTHDVPDQVAGHKFFLTLAKQGLVEDGDNQPVQHANIQSRSKALHDKIAQAQANTAGKRGGKLQPDGLTHPGGKGTDLADVHYPMPTKTGTDLADMNAPRIPGQAEVNPVTGKAMLPATGGEGVNAGINPNDVRPSDGIAETVPHDGSTGSAGGSVADPNTIPGAEGFGPKDDGESAAEEDSGPDSHDEDGDESKGKGKKHRNRR